mgnify:CR=1 FL=1
MSVSEEARAIRRRVRRDLPVALSAAALLLGVSGCASTSASSSEDFGGSRVQTAVLQNAQGAARGINMVSTTEVNSALIGRASCRERVSSPV